MIFMNYFILILTFVNNVKVFSTFYVCLDQMHPQNELLAEQIKYRRMN